MNTCIGHKKQYDPHLKRDDREAFGSWNRRQSCPLNYPANNHPSLIDFTLFIIHKPVLVINIEEGLFICSCTTINHQSSQNVNKNLFIDVFLYYVPSTVHNVRRHCLYDISHEYVWYKCMTFLNEYIRYKYDIPTEYIV